MYEFAFAVGQLLFGTVLLFLLVLSRPIDSPVILEAVVNDEVMRESPSRPVRSSLLFLRLH